ncbi:MAG: hypothetical protein K2H04_02985, partial [Bacteroidaceae bacterium]|nr:hypothetical protein [Bacteroidaceae bacterium]
DCDVFSAVTQYGRYNRDVPGVYWVVCPVRAFPVRNGSFKDGKQLGSWSICCFDLNMNVLENKIIGQTIKQTGLKNPVFNRNSYSFYTLFYRPMFSEAEIQAEINRIKYNI